MRLTPGTMVTANIRLIEPIGEGAMGSVWAADHLTLHTKVAVKFIAADLAAEHPQLVERFKREASVAARIKSPHVVQTFDQGFMQDGTPFIVMEMLEGETLQELLESVGPMPIAVATQVLVQLARALAKAHEAGVVHRDIKPDNIFVTPSDEGLFCKILDFGIAKANQLPQMGGLTHPGVMVGTPEFMSPEQVLSSKDVDQHADLWALTVTMYQLLSGRLPFTGEAIGELCMKLLSGKFTPITELRDDLHPSIDAWFARALARKPEDRYPSARELAHGFVAIVSEHHAVAGDATISSMLRALTDAHAGEVQAFTTKAAHTLSGSSSPKATTPSRVARRRSSAAVGVAVTVAALVLGGVVTFVVLRADDSSDAAAPNALSSTELSTAPTTDEAPTDSAATEASADEDATDEDAELETATSASASPSSSASAKPLAPRAVGARPPTAPPTTKPPPPPPIHRDHGF